MEQFPHGGGWYNYALGHGVSGPNSTQDSCEWLSHCLRLIMGRLHEKTQQLDPAFLSVDGCSAPTGIAHAKLHKCLLIRKRLFKAWLQTTLGDAWFERRWCLSGHSSVEFSSLSLALTCARVPKLPKFERFQNNLITWFVMLLVVDRTISSVFVMAILLNLTLFLLWWFRNGSQAYLSLFKTEPCMVIYSGKSYNGWSVSYLFCFRETGTRSRLYACSLRRFSERAGGYQHHLMHYLYNPIFAKNNFLILKHIREQRIRSIYLCLVLHVPN